MTEWIEISQLRLSDVRPAGYVPRPSASMRRRIQAHGVIDPVVVRPSPDGQFEILSNAEVWRAAGEAGLHRVPVVVRDDLDDEEAAEVVESHYGQTASNAINEAEAFAEQLDALGGRGQYGAVSKVAALSGHRRSYVAHSLRLLELPDEIQAMVRHGRISAGHARALLRLPKMRQRAAARRIADERLSVRDSERLVAGILVGTNSAGKGSPGRKDPDLVRLEQQVSALLGARFEVDEGKAVIDFHGDLEILDGILRRIGYRGG